MEDKTSVAQDLVKSATFQRPLTPFERERKREMLERIIEASDDCRTWSAYGRWAREELRDLDRSRS